MSAFRFLGPILGVGCLAASSISYLSHTHFKDAYRQKFHQLYDDTNEIILIDKQTKSHLVENVLSELNLPPVIEARLWFFTCRGKEVTQIGTLYNAAGCFIGIPENFKVSSPLEPECIEHLKLHQYVLARAIILSEYSFSMFWSHCFLLGVLFATTPTGLSWISEKAIISARRKKFGGKIKNTQALARMTPRHYRITAIAGVVVAYLLYDVVRYLWSLSIEKAVISKLCQNISESLEEGGNIFYKTEWEKKRIFDTYRKDIDKTSN